MGVGKAAWCCLTGTAHSRNGYPCQDKIAYHSCGNVAAMALADGAGSRLKSYIGAQLVVNECVKLFCSEFDLLYLLNEENIRKEVLSAVLRPLKKSGYPLEELASTLIFSAVSEKRYICGHIGDGLLLQYSGTSKVFSPPENGEFCNETFFLTDPGAEKHLRIYRGLVGSGGGFMLMSDGTAVSLYDIAQNTLSPVCDQFFDWMKHEEEAQVSKALEQNMKEYFTRKSSDDISVGIVME